MNSYARIFRVKLRVEWIPAATSHLWLCVVSEVSEEENDRKQKLVKFNQLSAVDVLSE